MNFLGLGFNFGAQDKGLGDTIKTTGEGFSDIGKSVAQIGLASAKMAFKPPNLGPMVGQVSSILTDVKLTTTGLEAFGVAASKASSAGLAGLNKTSTEIKKLKGLAADTAFSMKIGPEETTKSIVALTQAGYDANGAFGGFRNFSEFQKVMSVSGADAAKTAASMRTLEAQYGMTGNQVGNLIKKNIALGKRMNMGTEAMQGFGEEISYLSDNAARLGDNFSANDMERYVLGATKMRGAFMAAGASAEEAASSTRKMTDTLLAGQTGMGKVFAGLDADLPEGMKTITEHFGSVQGAFDMMKKSPDEFAAKMASTMDKVKAAGASNEVFNRLRNQLSDTFGPGMVKGVDKGGKVMQEALEKANAPGLEPGDAIKAMAAAYEDGRTASERFAIAQDRLLTRMKQISGVMGDQEYLKRYKKNTNELHKTLSKTAAKGGPLGSMTKMLIEMRVHGIGGALESHSKWGLALGELANQFGPILRVLPGIGMAIAALASPIVVVAAAIAGLAFVFSDLAKGSKSIVRPWLDKLESELPEMMDKVGKFFKKTMSVVGPAIITVIDKIPWKKVGEALGAILAAAAELSLKIFEGVFNLGGKLLEMLGNINWEGVGKWLGGFLSKVFVLAIQMAAMVLINLPKIIYKVITGAWSLIMGLIDGIVDNLGKRFPILATLLKGIGMAIKGVIIVVAAIILSVLIPAIASAVAAFAAAAAATVMFWGPVVLILGAIGLAVYAVVKAIQYLAENARAIGSAVVGFFDSISDAIVGVESTARKSGKTMADEMKIAMDKAHKAAIKSKAAQIKTVKQLNAETNVEVKAMVQEQIKAGKLFETASGKILKAEETLVKFSRTAKGELVKVNYELAKMNQAEVNVDSMKAGTAMMKEYRREVAKARRENGDLGAVLDKYQPRFRDFKKQHGYQAQSASALNGIIGRQLALHDDVLNKVAKIDKTYAESLKIRRDQIATEVGLRAEANERELESDLAALRKKGIYTKEADKAARAAYSLRGQEIEKDLKAYNQKVMESAHILSGDIEKVGSKFRENGKFNLAFSERVAATWANNTRAAGKKIVGGLKNVSSEHKRLISQRYEDIAKAQQNETKEFLRNTKLKGDDLKKATEEIKLRYKSLVTQTNKDVMDASENLAAGTVDSFKRSSDQMLKDNAYLGVNLKKQTNDYTGEIEKTMEISADKAADMVGTIANINPKDFRNNMRIIRTSFKKFLGDLNKESKALMDKGGEYMNLFWDTSTKGWENQTNLLMKWAGDAETHIRKYWTAVITEAGKAVLGFMNLASSIQASLKASVAGFNILSLLASPNQIRSWAQSVTTALATALRGGHAVKALTMASYDEAISMYNRSTASAEGGGSSTSGGSSASGSAARQGAMNMVRTINNPEWTREGTIPSELKDINENLKNLMEVTKASLTNSQMKKYRST